MGTGERCGCSQRELLGDLVGVAQWLVSHLIAGRLGH
jgi:hypothetical protein